MKTRRALARQLMEEMKAAYVEIDRVPYEDDPDGSAQAIGRYDGLKRAYVLASGRSAQDIGSEVGAWYVSTPEYQEAKKAYTVKPGPPPGTAAALSALTVRAASHVRWSR